MNIKTPNEALERWTTADLKGLDKAPITIILDNVRSAQNVGSLFRTMDGFRCKELILCGITAKPPHREINKTAIGATESVKWSHHENTLEACKILRSQGFMIYGVEQTSKSIFLQDFIWPDKKEIALIFGNEVDGVNQEVIDFCDGTIEIPQFGSKHSLNISVSAGIVIWDLFSRYCIKHFAQS